MPDHSLKLSNGSANLLRSILMQPEATTTMREKFAAGLLLVGELEETPQMPDNIEPKQARNWARAGWKEVSLSESMREACKAGLKWAVTKGVAPPGSALNELLEQLGLTE